MATKAQAATGTVATEFISNLNFEHGPRELLGRYFLVANKALVDRGIHLEISPFEELLQANEANRDSWLPLFPTLNPRFCRLNTDNAFCLVGRDASGKVVATQAGRLFDWRQSSFADAARSMQLLYDEPAASANPGEQWDVSAPMASELRGMIAFTGAVWYHPEVRGRGLASLMPRLARAYAIARWNVGATVVMMSKTTYSKGLHRKTGHVNVQDGVHAKSSSHGDVDYLFFWMLKTDIIRELGDALAAQGDGIAQANGNAKQTAAGQGND